MTSWEIRGKRVLITGGNTGIGFATAQALLARGAVLYLTARDMDKGSKARARLKAQFPGSEVQCLPLDLASFRSIRALASELTERTDDLHVLIHNAGLALSERRETEEGFEMTFGVNHLGPFLLTQLLWSTLLESTPARIIHVASDAHRRGGDLDFDDLQFTRRRYSGIQAYCRSKLANILTTVELARRLQGHAITANALHPGVVATRFAQDGDVSGPMDWLIKLARPFFISPARGAETIVHLSTSPALAEVSGHYFAKCRPSA
ncbi:MAG: SDR family oxidoreductase, partial [Polyangiales bacterium]